MTVEIVYSLPHPLVPSDWQVSMAKQIESNRGFPIEDVERELDGGQLFVRVDTNLPNTAVENMLSDIEDHLPPGSAHVDTREVEN